MGPGVEGGEEGGWRLCNVLPYFGFACGLFFLSCAGRADIYGRTMMSKWCHTSSRSATDDIVFCPRRSKSLFRHFKLNVRVKATSISNVCHKSHKRSDWKTEVFWEELWGWNMHMLITKMSARRRWILGKTAIVSYTQKINALIEIQNMLSRENTRFNSKTAISSKTGPLT